MNLETLPLDQLLNDLNRPIPTPQEGEIYHYHDEVDDTEFDFKILEEHKEHWDVEILGKDKIEKLPKDFGTVEMFNVGIIKLKKGIENA